MNTNRHESVKSVESVSKKLHERVMVSWAKYQALSLELLGLEGRVADCRTELTATAKEIYELYQKSDAGLDGEQSQKTQEN